MLELMSDSTEIRPIEPIDDLAIPEAGWKKRLTINKETGKIALSHEDAISAWKDFAVEETKKALLTGKLAGNRNAGVAKMALFQRFIEGESKDEDAFKEIAYEMNFNPDTAETYWIQFQVLFAKRFRAFLLDAKFPKKVDKKTDILEF